MADWSKFSILNAMKKVETIAGIDFGSTCVRVVVGQPLENGQIHIMGVGEAPSRGISKGVIVDLEETVTSLSEALERAERMIGTPLSRVVVGVTGSHCKVVESQGIVAVSKPNGEVTQSDVDRADEQSQAVAAAPNYEILHVLPKYYNLDSQHNIKDPLGMTGIKLEAHTQVILALSSQVKHLTKCITRTQLELEGLIFAPLATAQAALSKRQKDLGVALVNIGSWTTSVGVFEEGEMLHAAVLPIGSDHITGDIAIGVRLDVDVAERIKTEMPLLPASKFSKRDELDVSKFSRDPMPRHMFPKKEIADIIQARLEEICSMIQAELKKAGRAGKLPAGIVLTGGGARLAGIVEFMRDQIKLPVFVSSTSEIATPIDKVKDVQFTTALGLVYFANPESPRTRFALPGKWLQGNLGGLVERFKRIIS